MELQLIVLIFIIGVVVGIAIHRLIMAMVLDRKPDTMCAYCEWFEKGKSRRIK